MFGEKLTMVEASIVALFSITVVFLVLLLIAYMSQLVAAIINKAQKPKETPAPKSAPVEKSAPAAPVKEEKADDNKDSKNINEIEAEDLIIIELFK